MTLHDWTEVTSIFDAAFKEVAIVVGGIASYYLFWRKRQVYPRAEVNLSIEQHRLPRQKLLIRVKATLKNTGEVLIQLSRGYANLCLIAPCDRRFNDEMEGRVSAD